MFFEAFGISIHALREEGDMRYLRPCLLWSISIHALREEGDVRDYVRARARQYISIHALREEGDRNYMSCTRPLVNFYPRPPRGGRRQLSKVP